VFHPLEGSRLFVPRGCGVEVTVDVVLKKLIIPATVMSYISAVEISSTSGSVISRKPTLTSGVYEVKANSLTALKSNVKSHDSGVLLGVLLTSSDVGDVSHISVTCCSEGIIH
jgi:hypothetical protein